MGSGRAAVPPPLLGPVSCPVDADVRYSAQEVAMTRFTVALACLLLPASAVPSEGAPDALQAALEAEVQRTMTALAGQEDAPYFLGYRVADASRTSVHASAGALRRSIEGRACRLDVEARVGSHDLDSRHEVRDESYVDRRWHEGSDLPCDAGVDALRAAVWSATTREVRDAREAILKVRANRAVKVEEEDPSPDFDHSAPYTWDGGRGEVALDRAAWEPVVAALSARLLADPTVETADVEVDALAETRYVVTSEGTRVRQPRTWVRVAMTIGSTAPDGMDLALYRWRDVRTPADLPPRAQLEAWTDALVRDHAALRRAPRGEPYSGPVILRGRAAAVFVHEVLGHRAEGHRQKDETEGQTFRDQVGRVVTHPTITVYDDPNIETWAGEYLNGHYHVDEEGQPAERALLIEKGVFRGFLMSRSPIRGFTGSNGHGRAQPGLLPVSRMGVTVVESSAPLSPAALRRRLLDEVRVQKRPYGLVVDEIAGGFTMTGRTFPNSFNVLVETAWRVWADGRPDEPVRGIDLVGTPLVAIGSIVAAGDDPAIFNGFCGAESGSVPNSAVSPSLLLRTLEVQRKDKEQDRPPLLPRPDVEGGAP